MFGDESRHIKTITRRTVSHIPTLAGRSGDCHVDKIYISIFCSTNYIKFYLRKQQRSASGVAFWLLSLNILQGSLHWVKTSPWKFLRCWRCDWCLSGAREETELSVVGPQHTTSRPAVVLLPAPHHSAHFTPTDDHHKTELRGGTLSAYNLSAWQQQEHILLSKL